MAELVFEKVYTDSSTELSNVCISNEPDNTLTKFFVEAQRQGNHLSAVALSDYDEVTWRYATSLLTSQAVTGIGIKSFPQIGAIGFYTLKYENKSLIVAPVYTKSTLYSAPELQIEVLADTLRITISNPTGVTYDCFRVVLRNGYFAEEYVTYEPTLTIPFPARSGIYAVTTFGYLNERLASRESQAQYVDIISTEDPTTYLATERGEVLLLGDTRLAI